MLLHNTLYDTTSAVDYHKWLQLSGLTDSGSIVSVGLATSNKVACYGGPTKKIMLTNYGCSSAASFA